MFTRSKKIISMLIVFVIVFTYMGQTLEAIATTDGLSAITNGFFGSGEMKFNSYFDENGEQKNEKISNVNQKSTLVLELSPNELGKGFLKDGTILANSLDGSDINFKFSKIKNVIIDEPEEIVENEETDFMPEENVIENNVIEEENTVQEENTISEEDVSPTENTVEENVISDTNLIENNTVENNTVVENNVINENVVDENSIKNDVVEESNVVENEAVENSVSLKTEDLETENIVENETVNEVTSRSSEPREENIDDNNETDEITQENEEETEGFINEEEVIQDATEEVAEETYEELTAKDFEIEITDDNQIKVQNVIYNTKIEVEIEYNKKDVLNISDLYKQINLQLKGTFINIDLERIETEANQEIVVGWEYNKEFDLSGEYTQISPFKLGEHTGIIVESKINVKRETEDENYLPIKQTTVEVDVPDYNGKQPETVNVQSTKLMATKGEDLGEVVFGEDNWNYDAQNKKITITVTNEKDGTAVNSIGEDEYLIVYRYNDYTEDEKVTMDSNFKVTVEEYSSNNNVITTKEWHNTEEIKTQINDLITYNIGTTEETLNKAKVNANYNSAEAVYEADFTTTVNVNILTSDLLEEFKINSSKETYLDSSLTEFDATSDIYYTKVKFNYKEIKNMLQNGATIEIRTLSDDLLYTLNNDLVQNEESCEVGLGSKEKGIYVVFKNVSVNGNVSIEFTKAIGKSNYDKAAFNSFKKIKSYVSAELKYKNYDERYGMSEIATSKELKNSKTVAEISLSNNNLSTISKNDGVEVRIALNNDKLDSDLYINPSFELVFPKYVKNVTVESINLMYENGLRIADFQTFTEDEILKMRVELTGTQNTFSESVITNGTNILLNLNVELDEYTPRKQDQIKMYYCNEGVTNYESQTKWTIGKNVPNGILKDTNGFDVAVVNYQAPNGMVLSNGIINYDGQASKVKSIAQGERTAEIDIDQDAQIATMELVAMNNTENTCTDAIFMGRIPFKGNKSVVTGEDLGTTVTTSMLNGIQENIQNVNMTTIYYSENENATKDLNNSENRWTTNVINWQNIKSYMIVVKGEMTAGTILKYTYDFEVPAGLYYDETIYGSFCGFYNNNSKVAVYYESAEADKVGIVTKSSLPIKLKLDVDAGNKEEVRTNQYLTYILTVSNEGEETYSGITVNAKAPGYTYLCEKSEYSDQGNNGYIIANEQQKQWTIDSIQPGETQEFSYVVKIIPSYFEDMKIQNSVTMTIGNLNNQEIASNQVENYVKESSFDIQVASIKGNDMELGDTIGYRINYFNMTDSNYDEFKIVLNVPEGLEYESIEDDNGNKVEFDKDTRDLKITVKNLENNYGKNLTVYLKVNQINKRYVTLKPYIITLGGEIEYSTGTTFGTTKTTLPIASETNFDENQIVENQEIEITYNMKNNGDVNAKDLKLELELADVFEYSTFEFKTIANGTEEVYEKYIENNNVVQKLNLLNRNDEIQVKIKGKIKNIEEDQSDILLSKLKITGKNIEEQVQENKVSTIKDIGNNEVIQDHQEQSEGNYEISGNVWVDENGDGQKLEELESVSAVQVQLLKDGNMVKATTTDNSGNYKFTGLANGNYSVVYNYDKDTYTAVRYSGNETEEVTTSKGYELKEGTSVSNEIVIADNNVENINLGVQEKEKFDLSISETITNAIVNINGEETAYEYADLDLAKIEIKPSQIDKATVKFKYKIMIENTGNVEGKVTSIVDYLPAGMKFVEAENEGWSNGVDGNIYNDSLRDITIKPGEMKELTLVLSKKFNEDNTGVLSNKVKIAYTENSTRLTESLAGNFATQETIVTVTQGGSTGFQIVITTISLSGMIAMFAYMVKTGKLDSKFNGKSLIKKVYK